jgi:hypothetical protein
VPAVISLHDQRHKKSRRACCARLLTLFIIPSRGTAPQACQLTLWRCGEGRAALYSAVSPRSPAMNGTVSPTHQNSHLIRGTDERRNGPHPNGRCGRSSSVKRTGASPLRSCAGALVTSTRPAGMRPSKILLFGPWSRLWESLSPATARTGPSTALPP